MGYAGIKLYYFYWTELLLFYRYTVKLYKTICSRIQDHWIARLNLSKACQEETLYQVSSRSVPDISWVSFGFYVFIYKTPFKYGQYNIYVHFAFQNNWTVHYEFLCDTADCWKIKSLVPLIRFLSFERHFEMSKTSSFYEYCLCTNRNGI